MIKIECNFSLNRSLYSSFRKDKHKKEKFVYMNELKFKVYLQINFLNYYHRKIVRGIMLQYKMQFFFSVFYLLIAYIMHKNGLHSTSRTLTYIGILMIIASLFFLMTKPQNTIYKPKKIFNADASELKLYLNELIEMGNKLIIENDNTKKKNGQNTMVCFILFIVFNIYILYNNNAAYQDFNKDHLLFVYFLVLYFLFKFFIQYIGRAPIKTLFQSELHSLENTLSFAILTSLDDSILNPNQV